MKSLSKLGALLALAFSLAAIAPAVAADDTQYTFKVHNTTKETITKLLVSEDGKDYASFDVGKGIEAGAVATMAWDKSTNDRGCKWYFKAVFASGDESKPKNFDFCEEDLELEF